MIWQFHHEFSRHTFLHGDISSIFKHISIPFILSLSLNMVLMSHMKNFLLKISFKHFHEWYLILKYLATLSPVHNDLVEPFPKLNVVHVESIHFTGQYCLLPKRGRFPSFNSSHGWDKCPSTVVIYLLSAFCNLTPWEGRGVSSGWLPWFKSS